MGKRGPIPKPTALRVVHGDRKDRINDDEPQPTDGLPRCPAGVAADVREIWDYTLGELAAMKLATPADRDALMAYCEAVALHRRASRALAEEGLLVAGLHVGQVRHPAVQVQRDAAATVRAYAQEFGLTPSARSQIRLGAATPRREASGPARLLSG